jgi:hypothetical protein
MSIIRKCGEKGKRKSAIRRFFVPNAEKTERDLHIPPGYGMLTQKKLHMFM